MVPDTPNVESVAARIEPALHKGQLVIDMSTVAPAAERTIAERLAKAGVDYLDAPVSGGESGAIDGTLTIMVGGAEPAYKRALPLFEKLAGASRTWAAGRGPDDQARQPGSGRADAGGGGRSAGARRKRRAGPRARARGDRRGRGRLVAACEPGPQNNRARLASRLFHQAHPQGPAAGRPTPRARAVSRCRASR